MKSLEFNKNIKKSGKPFELSGSDYKNIPHNEDTREEQDRINKNDPGVSIKTGEAFKYIPKEEIAEYDGDVEERLAEEIDNSSKEKDEEFLELDNTTEEELKKKRKEIKDTPINFFQDNIDVAHMGPDFESQKIDDEIFENEINLLKKEAYLGREALKEDSLPYFLSKAKFLRKIINGYYDYKKEKRRQNTGTQKDNLKTMPDSKKERVSRGKLREMNRDNKNYEDSFEREEYEELNKIIGNSCVPEFEDRIIPGLATLQKEEEKKMDNKVEDNNSSVGELEKIKNKERNIA